MTELHEIKTYLDRLLDIAGFPEDHSNNGLQVEGRSRIRKAVFGVDACGKIIDNAIESGADFIFVHHGLSWGSNFRRITGYNASLIGRLLKNGISLYAAHLPLDAHPSIGNNAVIAGMLKISRKFPFAEYDGRKIGFAGTAPKGATPAKFAKLLDAGLDTKSVILGKADCEVRKVGVISGGAGSEGVMSALECGLDCLVTGEITHCTYHMIMDNGLKVVGAGHYSSEITGPRAVMDNVAGNFGIKCEFADFPTGL